MTAASVVVARDTCGRLRAMAPKPRKREPQLRSIETREKLLTGAVECLVKYGYAGTTTNTLCEVSGISRGGQQHHFPTREGLIITAVEHLTARVIEIVRNGAENISPNEDPVSAVLKLLWDGFSDRWFSAAYELWVAARTDETLRAVFIPAERSAGRAILKLCLEVLPRDITEQDCFNLNLQCTINMMHGLALTHIIRTDETVEAYTLSLCREILLGKLRAS